MFELIETGCNMLHGFKSNNICEQVCAWTLEARTLPPLPCLMLLLSKVFENNDVQRQLTKEMDFLTTPHATELFAKEKEFLTTQPMEVVWSGKAKGIGTVSRVTEGIHNPWTSTVATEGPCAVVGSGSNWVLYANMHSSELGNCAGIYTTRPTATSAA
jgi:hypothetical protein